MSPKGASDVSFLLLLVITSLTFTSNASEQQASRPPSKIIFPRLHPQHYQYWLKHHPLAQKEFENICDKIKDKNEIDFEDFEALHANLSVEDKLYLENPEYGIGVIKTICSSLKNIPKLCWGYEKSCHNIYLMPKCGSNQTKDLMIKWFEQVDFGFISQRRLELNKFCSPDRQVDPSVQSYIECTKNFRTCRGSNLYIDFKLPPNHQSLSDMPNFIKDGDVGGMNCYLESKRIKEEDGKRGYLQSWFNELEYYKLVNYTCDETIDKPVYFIKYDNPTSMYDFLGTFVYLYTTMHLYQRFTDDNQIILWDRSIPQTNFDGMWTAFSRNGLRNLNDFDGKRICFKNYIFAMPPRMDNGFYHDQDIPDCSKSGLFHAFNKHVLNKFYSPQMYTPEIHQLHQNKLIRITILATSIHLENLGELVTEVQRKSDDEFRFAVTVINSDENDNFPHMLNLIHNTDVLLGSHEDELTYTLFLPDWASLVQLTSSKSNRYQNLARLRGVSYFEVNEEQRLLSSTGPNYQTDGQRSSYNVDIKQFVNILQEQSRKVKQARPAYFADTDLTKETAKPSEPPKSDTPNSHEEL